MVNGLMEMLALHILQLVDCSPHAGRLYNLQGLYGILSCCHWLIVSESIMILAGIWGLGRDCLRMKEGTERLCSGIGMLHWYRYAVVVSVCCCGIAIYAVVVSAWCCGIGMLLWYRYAAVVSLHYIGIGIL